MRKKLLPVLCSALLALTGYSTIMALTMAKGGNSPPPPPPECSPAFGCARIDYTYTQDCAMPGVKEGRMYWVHNRHSSRQINVSYDWLVRHLNTPTPMPSERGSDLVTVGALQREELGCEKVKGLLGEQIDLWSYSVRAACFADDCRTTSSNPSGGGPVQKPDGPPPSCRDECEKGGPNCIRYELSHSVPEERGLNDLLDRFARTLNTTPFPVSVPSEDLAAVIAKISGEACYRSPLDIDAGGAAVQGGTTCRFPLNGTSGDRSVHGPEFRIPGTYEATATKLSGWHTSLASSDPETSWWMAIRKQDGSVVTERVTTFDVMRDQIIATGERQFCAAIRFRGG